MLHLQTRPHAPRIARVCRRCRRLTTFSRCLYLVLIRGFLPRPVRACRSGAMTATVLRPASGRVMVPTRACVRVAPCMGSTRSSRSRSSAGKGRGRLRSAGLGPCVLFLVVSATPCGSTRAGDPLVASVRGGGGIGLRYVLGLRNTGCRGDPSTLVRWAPRPPAACLLVGSSSRWR